MIRRSLWLRSGIKVKIDKQTGAVSFLDLSDHVLLQEAARKAAKSRQPRWQEHP